jgi:hypothetical protein
MRVKNVSFFLMESTDMKYSNSSSFLNGSLANPNEINSHINTFAQQIQCLNILGRLKLDEKIVTPKQKGRPWRILIQPNTYGLTGLITRFYRTFWKDQQYTREDNLEYIKSMVDDFRNLFRFLFEYMSKYIIQNNDNASKHWNPAHVPPPPPASPIMTFENPKEKEEDSEDKTQVRSSTLIAATVLASQQALHSNDSSKSDGPSGTSGSGTSTSRSWMFVPRAHLARPTKAADRALYMSYRLCRCTSCILNSERMTISRIGELLVQGLAAMSNAIAGIENLKNLRDGRCHYHNHSGHTNRSDEYERRIY